MLFRSGTCCAIVDALPRGLVGEIHLAGYADGGAIVIDDHGSRVRDGVWAQETTQQARYMRQLVSRQKSLLGEIPTTIGS